MSLETTFTQFSERFFFLLNIHVWIVLFLLNRVVSTAFFLRTHHSYTVPLETKYPLGTPFSFVRRLSSACSSVYYFSMEQNDVLLCFFHWQRRLRHPSRGGSGDEVGGGACTALGWRGATLHSRRSCPP